jgi:threonine/homoserine/homoserine lactone efflux protein
MTLPVDLPTLGAFALAALAIVISPGPDTMLILRCSLTSGQRAGLAAVAGIQLGLIAHTILAAVGVSVLIASSPPLFKAVALAGAGYLGWLGIQGFRPRRRLAVENQRPPVSAGKALRDAMVTNILNPKVIILFLALYPNFVVLGRGAVWLQLVTLSVLLIAINVAWQAPMAWAADQMRRWLGRPSVQHWLTVLTSSVLLAFAVLMIYEHVIR